MMMFSKRRPRKLPQPRQTETPRGSCRRRTASQARRLHSCPLQFSYHSILPFSCFPNRSGGVKWWSLRKPPFVRGVNGLSLERRHPQVGRGKEIRRLYPRAWNQAIFEYLGEPPGSRRRPFSLGRRGNLSIPLIPLVTALPCLCILLLFYYLCQFLMSAFVSVAASFECVVTVDLVTDLPRVMIF